MKKKLINRDDLVIGVENNSNETKNFNVWNFMKEEEKIPCIVQYVKIFSTSIAQIHYLEVKLDKNYRCPTYTGIVSDDEKVAFLCRSFRKTEGRMFYEPMDYLLDFSKPLEIISLAQTYTTFVFINKHR